MLVADLLSEPRKRVSLKFSDPATAQLEKCDRRVLRHAERRSDGAGAGIAQSRRTRDRHRRGFRIKDIAEWQKWYGMTHACPEVVAEAVYGLPEVEP